MTSTTDLPVPIEEKHGPDCICTEVGRIDLTLVAANRACPGDRNPARGSRTTATLDDAPPADYPGRGITITWPETKGNGYPLASWPMQIHDHDTGEQLLTVSGLRIVLGGDDWTGDLIQADLTMLVNADGAPLGKGERAVSVEDGRRAKTGVFRAYVVEMRTTAPDPDEIRLIGWDGPIAELTIRYRRDSNGTATPDPTWGRRIATTARMIVGENCLHVFPNTEPIGDARCEQCGITHADLCWLHPRLAAELAIPTRESVTRGEHAINQYREYHGIGGSLPDLTEYAIEETRGGMKMVRHVVDACDRTEMVFGADDDSLSTLIGLATQHHTDHHGGSESTPALADTHET